MGLCDSIENIKGLRKLNYPKDPPTDRVNEPYLEITIIPKKTVQMDSNIHQE